MKGSIQKNNNDKTKKEGLVTPENFLISDSYQRTQNRGFSSAVHRLMSTDLLKELINKVNGNKSKKI